MGGKRNHNAKGWHAQAPLSGEAFYPEEPSRFTRGVERLIARLRPGEDPLKSVAEPADPDDPLPPNVLGTRTVRFFQEYGCDSPFWGINAFGPFESNELGLSAALDRRSREFMAFWEQHFHYDTEWDSAANKRAWWRAGNKLLSDVRAALTNTDIVILDERW